MTRKWCDSTAGEHAETGVGGGELTDAMLSAEQRQGAWGPAESDSHAGQQPGLGCLDSTSDDDVPVPLAERSGSLPGDTGWTMTTIGDNASRSRDESAVTTARVGL